MAELDPFYDLPYPNLPGYGETDASQDPSLPSPAPAPEPTIPMPGADPVPMPVQLPPVLMPPGPSSAAPRRRAGAAIVLCGVGVGTGAMVGGLWGAGSGLLFAGAVMNAYRAKMLFGSGADADRGEAVKSTVMSVLGLGLGSYLGYRAHQAQAELSPNRSRRRRRAKRDRDDDYDDED